MAADYGRPLIVPMTLVNHGYRAEIFGLIGRAGIPLLHVFLDVPAEELHRRIDARVVAPGNPEQDADTLVLRGDQHTPAELADLVLQAAG